MQSRRSDVDAGSERGAELGIALVPVILSVGTLLILLDPNVGAATLNVVIRWKRGLPAGRDEPWFPMTDLSGDAVRLTDLYARRVAVEELFRDAKGTRYGLGLGPPQVTTTARLDRLIPIVALAAFRSIEL